VSHGLRSSVPAGRACPGAHPFASSDFSVPCRPCCGPAPSQSSASPVRRDAPPGCLPLRSPECLPQSCPVAGTVRRPRAARNALLLDFSALLRRTGCLPAAVPDALLSDFWAPLCQTGTLPAAVQDALLRGFSALLCQTGTLPAAAPSFCGLHYHLSPGPFGFQEPPDLRCCAGVAWTFPEGPMSSVRASG
jgi:hypothetical protein